MESLKKIEKNYLMLKGKFEFLEKIIYCLVSTPFIKVSWGGGYGNIYKQIYPSNTYGSSNN